MNPRRDVFFNWSERTWVRSLRALGLGLAFIFGLAVLDGFGVGVRAAGGAWGNDLVEAKTRAKAEGRMILLGFTASDSCEWCQRFKKDVLDQEEFIEFSRRSLVLVEVDYPKDERQSVALKRANAELKKRYLVGGYPTFVLLDSSGEEIGRQVGYLRGGPGAFLKKLRSFVK